MAEFINECVTYRLDRFDLRHLPPVMRAEFAYALQRRADEARTQTRPDQLRRLLKRLPAGAESFRDHDHDEWLELLGWRDRKSTARRFLADTLGWLDDLDHGVGWDSEFDRDIWQLRRLGYPNRDRRLCFDRIGPAWLRLLTKRWARWRLSTGIGPASVAFGLICVIDLAAAFPELAAGPQALTRDLIERHLANLTVAHPNAKGRTLAHLAARRAATRAARQHGWEPRLPATAAVYHEDYPRQLEPSPRAISEAVMAQLEDPANLDRFDDPQARVLAEILMRSGLRVGDGVRLALDCVVQTPTAPPTSPTATTRCAATPWSPSTSPLATTIATQQRQTMARFPTTGHLLVREKRNPVGHLHYSADTFRHRLTSLARRL